MPQQLQSQKYCAKVTPWTIPFLPNKRTEGRSTFLGVAFKFADKGCVISYFPYYFMIQNVSYKYPRMKPNSIQI